MGKPSHTHLFVWKPKVITCNPSYPFSCFFLNFSSTIRLYVSVRIWLSALKTWSNCRPCGSWISMTIKFGRLRTWSLWQNLSESRGITRIRLGVVCCSLCYSCCSYSSVYHPSLSQNLFWCSLKDNVYSVLIFNLCSKLVSLSWSSPGTGSWKWSLCCVRQWEWQVTAASMQVWELSGPLCSCGQSSV